MAKTKSVWVTWKFTIEMEKGVYEVRTPSYRFSDDELKGRSRWTVDKWLVYALEEYAKRPYAVQGIDKNNVQDVRVWTEYA